MKYLIIDAGGSSIKYALMDENHTFFKKGKIESRHLKDPNEFTQAICDLYQSFGCPEGGIAVSYCGELDEQSGMIFNGGSYRYLTGINLKHLLEKTCNTIVNIENDGNCAGLAKAKYGSLKGYANAALVVVGTGIVTFIFIDNQLYRGTYKYAGSTSLLVRNIEHPFTRQSWAFRVAGANRLGILYDERNGFSENTTDGFAFFEAVNAKNPIAVQVLKEYCDILANILLNIHLILDVEAIAIGGGISQQEAFQKEIHKSFDAIFQDEGMMRIHYPKPELHICQYYNDANLIGALEHHLERTGRK